MTNASDPNPSLATSFEQYGIVVPEAIGEAIDPRIVKRYDSLAPHLDSRIFVLRTATADTTKALQEEGIEFSQPYFRLFLPDAFVTAPLDLTGRFATPIQAIYTDQSMLRATHRGLLLGEYHVVGHGSQRYSAEKVLKKRTRASEKDEERMAKFLKKSWRRGNQVTAHWTWTGDTLKVK